MCLWSEEVVRRGDQYTLRGRTEKVGLPRDSKSEAVSTDPFLQHWLWLQDYTGRFHRERHLSSLLGSPLFLHPVTLFLRAPPQASGSFSHLQSKAVVQKCWISSCNRLHKASTLAFIQACCKLLHIRLCMSGVSYSTFDCECLWSS